MRPGRSSTPRGAGPALARALAAGRAALAAGQGAAQQNDAALTGHASLGVRSVDVDGAATKFREDVNLDDGVRLFDVSLSYTPAPDAAALVDRVDLSAESLGGDPFETIRLDARKHGAYELKLDRRRSEYFYDDVILPPELASISGSTDGDFHTFDFERVRDKAELDIHVSPATEVKLGLERFTRSGDSTTTLDIERDEFELERPIDESLNAFSAGVEHAWRRVTLVFEQQVREFENTSRLFLPGASSGHNPDDPAELAFFTADQSYDYDSRAHLVRVIARPTARLDVQAAWRREALDLDMQAEQRVQGTGFSGIPFSTEAAGPATVARDIELQELDFGYGLSDRLRVIGGVRRSTLEQDGRFAFGGERGHGLWDIETIGAEAGVELAPTPGIVVTAGVSTETRDADYSSALEATTLGRSKETERDGFFARLTARNVGGFEIEASLEDDDFDDPYTLASPTQSRRYRGHLRRRWDSGLSLTASLRTTDLKNAATGWEGDTKQADLRLAYNGDRLALGFGAALIDLSRSVVQQVVGGARQELFLIDYDADVRSFDGSVRWQLNERLALGGRFRAYENGGSFPLEHDDVRGFVEVALGREYLLRFGYRHIDYVEDGFDDYDAELLEAALGIRW